MTDAELAAALADAVEDLARKVAREEIASLAGLVVRRTQEDEDALAEAGYDSPPRPTTRILAEIFGEALNDFTTEEEPGT